MLCAPKREPAAGGTHTRPLAQLPKKWPVEPLLPHCAPSPWELDRQLVTFVLLSQPAKLLLADGHGKVPEPAKPGQHWSPAHVPLEPGHGTRAPRVQAPPSAPVAPRAARATSRAEHAIERRLHDRPRGCQDWTVAQKLDP
mmetsp:Transcript_19104/g.50246  ORF Transcript_19104/g.50246 Transcript_19104/m.50246 type:complete len:141 (+) Transcript_19104:832-1254(+)